MGSKCFDDEIRVDLTLVMKLLMDWWFWWGFVVV